MHNHPLRIELHNEIHTRPRPVVASPQYVCHASVLHPQRLAPGDPTPFIDWCRRHGVALPNDLRGHVLVEHGALRVKWERHGEFDDFTVYDLQCDETDPFARAAGDQVLDELLAAHTGQVIAALRIAVVRGGDTLDTDRAEQVFNGADLVGAAVADEHAALFSDFRLDERGFGRFLLVDRTASSNQLGRAVQRVIEVEEYRMMAMLAFPEARDIGTELDQIERALSGLVARINVSPSSEEPEILQEITALSANLEWMSAASAFRLSAAKAYRTLVLKRGDELRESRLPRMQTFSLFLERRFEPAMDYCAAVRTRLETVSERVARASSLLRTRVEFEQNRQSQELLAAMSRRAALQLRLQQTVEGLSVVAIAYYATGLFGYLFKAMSHAGVPIPHEIAVGLAVIPIVLAVGYSLHKAKEHLISKHEDAAD
jgi:uncharacterized membrane-anchored protein